MIGIQVAVPPTRPEPATRFFSYLQFRGLFEILGFLIAVTKLGVHSPNLGPERFPWVIWVILFLLSMLLGFVARRLWNTPSLLLAQGVRMMARFQMKNPRGRESRHSTHTTLFVYVIDEHANLSGAAGHSQKNLETK
jgi:hypothetical protein